MTCRDRRPWAALFLAVSACSTQGKPPAPPVLEAVSPAVAFADEDTPLVLSGSGFTPKATLRWGGAPGDVTTDAVFDVFVGDRKLNQVVWAGSAALTALLPAGLAPGSYAVRVVDPYGVEAALPNALQVRVRKGAQLTARLTTTGVLRVLKEVDAHLDITNVGDVAAEALGALQLPATGTAELTPLGVTKGKARLEPGESTRFELTWVSTKVGDAVLSGEARAVDAKTGAPLKAGPLTVAIQVVPPPDVTSTLTAVKKPVNRGQVIELVLEANNVGQGGVKDLKPVASASPAGLVDLKTAPLARDLAPGAKQPFSFFFDTRGAGDVTFRVDALGTDAITGETVAMAPAFETVTIVEPATLLLSAGVSAARVSPGQRFTVTATVTGAGGVVATPSSSVGGSGGVAVVTAPAPGATPATFTWEYDAVAKGPVQLTIGASGVDPVSGAAITAAPVVVWVLVATPPALSAAFTVPSRVNTGQSFGWSLSVTNSGDTAATGLTPGPIAVLGSSPGAADGGPDPASLALDGGATGSFTFAHVAGDAGTLRFQAAPSGTDPVGGGTVSAPATTSPVIIVERNAALAGVLTLPPSIAANAPFTATLQVTNTGGATALAVAPSAPAITGSATLLSGPAPTSAAIPGGGAATFTWMLMAGAAGTVQLSAAAAGIDANDAAPLSTGVVTSGTASVGEASLLATDPFGDGTAFANVFSYAGKVWLGPRKTGLGAVSMNADGTGGANHSFSFLRDPGVGASHKNSSASPYPSIGAAGCVANTAACGPNNENGRGLFFSASIGGVEFLGISGAHQSSQLEYVYVSPDTGPALTFRFIDLSDGTGGGARSVSAAQLFNNRLYLGMPDASGNRPLLFSVVSLVPLPGLNAAVNNQLAANVDVLDLEAHLFPGVGSGAGNTTPTQLVDSLADFNARLYVANNGGIVRSTTASPQGPGVAPADWTTATPSAAAYGAKTSVTTAKVSDLLPSDRAFPGVVAYQGRLYAARNTITGPQLWACAPGADGFCAPAEWSLVAANSTGDGQLTQLNDNSNQSIGLLAATATTLFIGFNNPMGIQLFKTTAAAPTSRADFTGTGGCTAGTVGCQGLNGNGLGASTVNRQIFDARALTFAGAAWLYLVTGNGTSGVRLYRIGG